MRKWTVRWNGKDGYEWDLFSPDSDKPIGGLWSNGLNGPHVQFILDALNAAEQRAERTYCCPVCLQPAIDARGLQGVSEAGKAVLRDNTLDGAANARATLDKLHESGYFVEGTDLSWRRDSENR